MRQNMIKQRDERAGRTSSLGPKLLCIGSGFLLIAAAGCTTYIEQPRAEAPPPPPPVYAEPPPQVYVAPPIAAVVEIRVESDFYEPLRPYGRWEVIAPYGRCWIPARLEADWRPYCNGHWERTEQGWYWASDESWGWATYHYGRWDWSPEFGWFWVPQVQWAPAWVSWHETDGYIGWAPLHPSATFAAGGVIEVNERVIRPRAVVLVEERRFLEPVRPTTVINNTTIINKTVNITNIKVVNNTVINEGPRTEVVERASGRKVQAVAVGDLRRKSEAQVVTRQPASPEAKEKRVQAPPVVHSQPAPKAATPPASVEARPIPKPVVAAPVPERPQPVKERVVREEKKPVTPPGQIESEIARRKTPQAPPKPTAEKRPEAVPQHELALQNRGPHSAEMRPKHELVSKQSKTNLVSKPQKRPEEQPKGPEKN